MPASSDPIQIQVQAAPPSTPKSPSQPIQYHSFDWDNCLMNSKVIDEILDIQQTHLRDATVDEIYNLIIKHNLDLLHSIPALNEHFYSLFSSRTCHAIDAENWFKKVRKTTGRHEINIGSCFLPMQKFIDAIAPSRFIPILLVDCFANTQLGLNYGLLTQDTAEIVSGDKNDADSDGGHTDIGHPICPCDYEKILLCYLQMQHAANSHSPGTPIEVHIYDDEVEAILPGIINYYGSNRGLIPKNVTLFIHHYNGDTLTQLDSIQGVGEADPHYSRTIRWIAATSIKSDPEKNISWRLLRKINVVEIQEDSILQARASFECQRADYAVDLQADSPLRTRSIFSPTNGDGTGPDDEVQRLPLAVAAADKNRDDMGSHRSSQEALLAAAAAATERQKLEQVKSSKSWCCW